MTLHFIHIPKTGGTALKTALPAQVRPHEHVTLLSHVEGEAITIVRDPVARFVSAFEWYATRHLVANHWASPDDLARAIPTDELARKFMRETLVFLPQSHWLDVDRPLLWVGRTETLDADYARLREMLGHSGALPSVGGHGRNAGPPARPMSDIGTGIIRGWYGDDLALLERL